MNEKNKQTIIDAVKEHLQSAECRLRRAKCDLKYRTETAEKGRSQGAKTRAQNELPSLEAVVQREQINVDDAKEALAAAQTIATK